MRSQTQNPEGIQIDPVCDMQVESTSKLNVEYGGIKYFFCSSHCRESFIDHPETYLKTMSASSISQLNGLAKEEKRPSFKTYFPLILILAYLVGIVSVIEFRSGHIDEQRMMNHFMGGFFVIFSFFKFLNLRGFAEAYRTYDIVAKHFPVYGWIYPFIEVALGIAYLSQISLWTTHLATLIVMSVSSIGVIQSLLSKSKFQCACLGTIFNLPMTKITLFEDLLMAAMAAAGLFL